MVPRFRTTLETGKQLGPSDMGIIWKNINIRKRRGRPYAWCSAEETEDRRGAGRGQNPQPKPVRDGASAQRAPAVAPTAAAGLGVHTLGRGLGGGGPPQRPSAGPSEAALAQIRRRGSLQCRGGSPSLANSLRRFPWQRSRCPCARPQTHQAEVRKPVRPLPPSGPLSPRSAPLS